MNSKKILVNLLLIMCAILAALAQADENFEVNSKKLKDDVAAFKNSYIKMFKSIRKQHQEALKRIGELTERQVEMMQIITEKVQESLKKSKNELAPFSTHADIIQKSMIDESTRNSMSVVLENVAFNGDLALRFPDVYHKLYDNNKPLKEILTWAVNFAKEIDLYDSTSTSLLNLMQQELEMIPKTENYINPYKVKKQKKQEADIKNDKNDKKDKKKKKKRGPGLSGDL